MGTQTLIQALQAIPWAEGEDGTTDLKDDSDDDDEKPSIICIKHGFIKSN